MARRMKRNDANGWQRGEGVYSSSKDLKLDRPPMWGVTPTPAGRTMGGSDISAKTERAANVNGGFSGSIPDSGTSGSPWPLLRALTMARRIFAAAKETAPPPPPVDEGAELKARIEALHAELNAWIDIRAQELKASHAGIPIGVLRNCIAGSDRSCPCRGALRIVAGDERDQEVKARQKKMTAFIEKQHSSRVGTVQALTASTTHTNRAQ